VNGRIVIAGAGPAGLMLAGELALAGVPVTVMDPLTERSPTAPGMAINSGSVEVLDQRGLMDDIREETFVFPGAHFSLIWLDPTRRGQPRADAYMVPQTLLEEILERRATALGVELRRGQRVVGLTEHADRVEVAYDGPGGPGTLRGDYLVGCDGAHSAVRTCAGIGFAGTEDPCCGGVVGDVEVDFSELAREHLGAYVAPTGAVYTGGPVGPGLLRVITIRFDRPAPPHDAPVTVEEFFAEVHEITGTGLASGPPRWLSRFGDATRHAERYRQGRVLLAGDAAHVSYPVNGLGLSTALQDSANLGWKLAAQMRGWAPPGLLDSYHAERHPVGARVCRDARAQAYLSHPPERVTALREILGELLAFDDVQRYFLDMVSGAGDRYPMLPGPGTTGPLVGRRPPYVPVRTADGEVDVVSLLRGGRGVLLELCGDPRRAPDLAGWKDRVEVVGAEPTAAIPATAVLLRPDGHVAWAAPGDGHPGLTEALTAWFGAPLSSAAGVTA